MKKLIAFFAIAISLTASAQKKEAKDTTKPIAVDTVYILSKGDIQIVQALLRQNTLSFNGKNLTFDDVLQMIQSIESKVYYLPRQQPNKEQPKK